MESRGPEDSKNVKTSQAYFFEGFISFFEDFSLTKSLFQHGHDVYMCNVYYYPYLAFGDQNKIVYSTRFVRRAIFFLYCPDFM